MAAYKHGEMDVAAHEKMFVGFIKVICWVGGLSIAALIFMALVNS